MTRFMLEELDHRLVRYLVLVAILVLGLVFFLLSSHDPNLQLKVVGIFLTAYVLWGVVHHYLDKDLAGLIVLEYLLVAVVAFVIIFSLLRFA